MRRRGVTVAELLVAITLLGVVAGAVGGVLAASLRAGTRVRERATRTATLRAVGQVVAREAAGLTAAELLVAGDTLRYRARRGAGVACAAGPAAVLVPEAAWQGWRLPQPGRDSLLVHDGAAWVALGLASVGGGTCPDGRRALALGVTPGWGGATAPVPVRVVEWMELRAYESGGAWWLGARSRRPTDAIQPVAGPVAPRGVAFARVPVAAGDTALEVRVRLVPQGRGSLALPADSAALRVRAGCAAC